MEYTKLVFQNGFLAINWKNGKKCKYSYYFLRFNCPCASCVDEWSGNRLIDEKSISKNIFPKKSNLIGNYAIQIEWSDGHKTGIYSWKQLYELDLK